MLGAGWPIEFVLSGEPTWISAVAAAVLVAVMGVGVVEGLIALWRERRLRPTVVGRPDERRAA